MLTILGLCTRLVHSYSKVNMTLVNKHENNSNDNTYLYTDNDDSFLNFSKFRGNNIIQNSRPCLFVKNLKEAVLEAPHGFCENERSLQVNG